MDEEPRHHYAPFSSVVVSTISSSTRVVEFEQGSPGLQHNIKGIGGGGGGTIKKRTRSLSSSSCEKDESTQQEIPKKKQKIKRPLLAYAYFEKEMRPLLKAQFPRLGGNVITQKIGQTWSYMAERDKQKYWLLERKGRAAYEEAMLEEREEKKTICS